jgi:general L-amino acid transport system substrate-binding protein
MRSILLLGLAAVLAAEPVAAQTSAGTLGQVRARGELVCGTNPGLAGFALRDEQGAWRGLDADTCRAVAAAVLGDATKVRFVPLGVADGIAALQAGSVDLLARNLTFTMSRDVDLGMSLTAVSFYDAQGFLVPTASGIRAADGLAGKRVCVGAGTSNEVALGDAARRLGITITIVPVSGFAGLRDAYRQGQCDAASSDSSQLAALRQGMDTPAAHETLPDTISREPLGPMVRDGEAAWRSIVTWSVNAMIEAEALGLTASNAAARRSDASPLMRRFLGAEPGLGTPLGLADDWAFRIVTQVGSYAEVFDRNLGAASALKLDRGLNALWNRGGLMYPIPMR